MEGTDLLPGLGEDYDGSNNDFIENYIVGAPYLYTRNYTAPAMVSMFANLPRFSHSNDFSYLFSQEPERYAMGLLFIAVWITAVFTFWLLLLVALKWLGPKQVGVLAGFPYKKESWKSISGRCVLSGSAIMMIVCTIILVTKGLTELQGVSNKVAVVTRDAQKIEAEMETIITNLRTNSEQAKPIKNAIVDFLSQDICPLKPGSATESRIRSIGNDANLVMIELDDFVLSDYESVIQGLQQTKITTTKIAQANPQFDSIKTTAVIIPYFIIPAVIFIAVGMGYYDVFSEGFYTVLTWCILPILVLLTIAAIVGAGWIAFAIEANSDFCYPSPEQTIYNILTRQFPNATRPSMSASLEQIDTGVPLSSVNSFSDSSAADGIPTFDNFFYDTVLFYSNQCDTTKVKNPWLFLESHYDDLGQARNVLIEFLKLLNKVTLAQLTQECGAEYAPIYSLLTQLQTYVEALSDVSTRALDLVACQNIVPLYTAVIYDATCTYSVVGATWMLSCSICIAFFGILCIMFRGAYYPLGYYYYESSDGEKSLYGTSEDGDDSSEDYFGNSIGESPHPDINTDDDDRSGSHHGDHEDDDDKDDEENDLFLHDNDDDSFSFIETMKSRSMLVSIDADVYADGIVIPVDKKNKSKESPSVSDNEKASYC